MKTKETEEIKFKPGDMVQLKTRKGPVMVVASVMGSGHISCHWFYRAEVMGYNFYPEELEYVTRKPSGRRR